jgi:hypothetical protein
VRFLFKSKFYIFILLTQFIYLEQAYSQAFCSLRDPLETINKLAPKPIEYSSNVIELDDSARDFFLNETGLKMHNQELGYHTIYQVSKTDEDEKDIIHVRPESTPWGLMEIAWLLSNDGKLKNFTFQRCRSPYCNDLSTNQFINKLTNLDYEQLRELLDPSLSFLSSKGKETLSIPEGSETLAIALIRSALKASSLIKYIEFN